MVVGSIELSEPASQSVGRKAMYLQMLTRRSGATKVATSIATRTEIDMQSEIKRWGNSAAVRLSSKILAQARLSVSSPIRIEVEEGKIVIEAVETASRKVNLPFSEADLLKGLDARGAHADELAQPSATELGG